MELIKTVMNHMYYFQKENNIKKCCMQNVQYLYDFITTNFLYMNVEPMSIIVIYINEDKSVVTSYNHMVLLNKKTNKILEPSYEVGILQNTDYFDSFNTFLIAVKNLNITNDHKKKVLEEHIKFCKHAEEMKQGKLIITDKKIYNDQADYIEKQCKKFLKRKLN